MIIAELENEVNERLDLPPEIGLRACRAWTAADWRPSAPLRGRDQMSGLPGQTVGTVTRGRGPSDQAQSSEGPKPARFPIDRGFSSRVTFVLQQKG